MSPNGLTKEMMYAIIFVYAVGCLASFLFALAFILVHHRRQRLIRSDDDAARTANDDVTTATGTEGMSTNRKPPLVRRLGLLVLQCILGLPILSIVFSGVWQFRVSAAVGGFVGLVIHAIRTLPSQPEEREHSQ